MSTVSILAVGVRPERVADDAPDVVELPVPSDPARLPPIADAFAAAAASGLGVAIFPDWLGDEALARVESAGSVAAASRVAILGTALPPLAAGVLAGVAAELSRHMSPGAAIAATRRLESSLRVFAWLGTVARLPDPRPGPLQRLGSLLPSGGWIVSSWPEPRVRHARHAWGDAPALTEDALLLAGGEDARRLLVPLAPVLDGVPRRQAPPTPLGPGWWGTAKLVEAVGYPAELPALAARLDAEITLEPCAWCDEPVAQSPCPFCGSVRGG